MGYIIKRLFHSRTITGAMGAKTVGGVVGGGVGAVGVILAAANAAKTVGVVGSFFGCTTQAAAILGYSTTQAYVLGLTSATVAGCMCIIACIGVGVGVAAGLYYVYTRSSGNPNQQSPISQAYSAQPIHNNNNNFKLPQFKPIQMTQGQFDKCLQITKQVFEIDIEQLKCPLSNQVMRQPTTMKCCKTKSKFGEKCMIQQHFKRKEQDQKRFKKQFQKRCPLCISLIKGEWKEYLQFNRAKWRQIFAIRCQLAKVYMNANNQQRSHWEVLIDNSFGDGYTNKHLKTFQITK